MPELPDVEIYKRYLDATALHKTITAIEVGSAAILRATSGRMLAQALRGRSMERTWRHGKHLLAALDDGRWLTLHFGMTGRLKYFKDLKDDPAYDRLRFDFANGYHLAYESRRLLGEVGLIEDPGAFLAARRLGPDAMALDRARFLERMRGRRGQVKSALMDQHFLAGIGNVYSDEILFRARLHPKTPVQHLDDAQRSDLYRAMREVLQTAIDRGAGRDGLADRLPPSYLLPHRERGAACPRCGGEIRTLSCAGRTAYYCPRCQPIAT